LFSSRKSQVDIPNFSQEEHMKRVLLIFLGLIVVAAVTLAWLSARVVLPGEEVTPAGTPRDTAVYVTMRDGVEVAVDLWLPPSYSSGQHIPALMRTTRYWRQPQLGWAHRMLVALGGGDIADIWPTFALTDYLNHHGYAVIFVDARGSGASGGDRVLEHSPEEVADIGEVAEWAARQPWSNGRVGAFGVSYTGNSAELSAVPNVSVMRAVAPMYDDFDGFTGLLEPGGVYTQGFMEPWSKMVMAMDRDDICAVDGVSGWKCWWTKQLTPGVKPVDADRDGKHLAELVARRHSQNPAQGISKVAFRDDPIMTLRGPVPFSTIAPYGQRQRIQSSGVPMLIRCGWMDAATCEGTLSRYLTFTNPQQVMIGPCSHGCLFNADPFLPPEKHTPPDPTIEEQYSTLVRFFDRFLVAENPVPLKSNITYYTLGEGKWHTTTTWPPAEFTGTPHRLYAAERGGLSEQAPGGISAYDSYVVDFSTSTGKHTRWHTQNDDSDVVYPDRAAEDAKLLTYTGAPLETDVEITGSPVVTLEVASTVTDGAFFAYLEDVAPNGRVTYLDEGIFRALNRKLADPKLLPYTALGPPHSYLRADAEPLVPGMPAQIQFSLFPTSLLLHKGHRIRLALAGADTPLFKRCPLDGTPTWTVFRQKGLATYLDLPMRPR
jgi:uncharacterized protein